MFVARPGVVNKLWLPGVQDFSNCVWKVMFTHNKESTPRGRGLDLPPNPDKPEKCLRCIELKGSIPFGCRLSRPKQAYLFKRHKNTKKKRNHSNLIPGHCNGFTTGIRDPERWCAISRRTFYEAVKGQRAPDKPGRLDTPNRLLNFMPLPLWTWAGTLSFLALPGFLWKEA